ncbi:unnamed protein product [Moneuplotes crassus]|uniref:G patch domain-containing protein n=1 Tax=Euplotes crassus TaxID=5936 RepID=A0AAD1U795_EUPCR|nr:unnamed protein product [Moneuplotes crassus]
MIGTPFEIKNDEIHNKRVSKKDRGQNDEYALNEKGQRRFHGAFTGGFHAGYNNTVGSEAGFKPAQFDRNKKYTVFDIMDEEDLGDHIQGQTIQTKEGFDTLGDGIKSELKNQLAHGALASMIPDELIVAPKSSIGYKLLKKLGWNERSKKNKHFTMEDEESDDSVDFDKMGLEVSDFINADAINNKSGVGVSSLAEKKGNKKIREKLKEKTKHETKIIKKDYDNYYKGSLKFKTEKYGLGYIPTSQDYIREKNRQINEFGEETDKSIVEGKDNRIDMGKLDFDGLVYHNEDKAEMEIMDEIGHDVQDKIKDKQMQNLFKSREEKNDFYSHGFLQTEKIEESKILVPKDYDPQWRRNQNMANPYAGKHSFSSRGRKLDANKRAELLGEGPAVPTNKDVPTYDPNPSNLDSKFSSSGMDLLPEHMMKKEDNLKGTKHLLVDIPFKDDKNKVQRFKNYVEEIENQMVIFDSSSNMMTGSQLRKEKEEFASLYQLELGLRKEKESSGKYASGVVSKEIEKEKKARTVTTDWQPCAILCKRFGLMDPFQNKKDLVGDFNKVPERNSSRSRKVEFVEKASGPIKPAMGDEFFYKIQKTVGRNDLIQQEIDKGEKGTAMSSKVQEKVQNITAAGYFDMDSDSGSDMEGVQESKANIQSIVEISKRPDQDVFENIFN